MVAACRVLFGALSAGFWVPCRVRQPELRTPNPHPEPRTPNSAQHAEPCTLRTELGLVGVSSAHEFPCTPTIDDPASAARVVPRYCAGATAAAGDPAAARSARCPDVPRQRRQAAEAEGVAERRARCRRIELRRRQRDG